MSIKLGEISYTYEQLIYIHIYDTFFVDIGLIVYSSANTMFAYEFLAEKSHG